MAAGVVDCAGNTGHRILALDCRSPDTPGTGNGRGAADLGADRPVPAVRRPGAAVVVEPVHRRVAPARTGARGRAPGPDSSVGWRSDSTGARQTWDSSGPRGTHACNTSQAAVAVGEVEVAGRTARVRSSSGAGDNLSPGEAYKDVTMMVMMMMIMAIVVMAVT
uniref:Uncharacterized protein n=1 Tax=Anopheles atroparvus TaxID=41427 RepID=A0A182IRN2_ANOAO